MKQFSSREFLSIESIVESEKPTFELGIDGLPYAVFPDNGYTYEYDALISGDGVACFDQYENAVCLQNTIGL